MFHAQEEVPPFDLHFSERTPHKRKRRTEDEGLIDRQPKRHVPSPPAAREPWHFSDMLATGSPFSRTPTNYTGASEAEPQGTQWSNAFLYQATTNVGVSLPTPSAKTMMIGADVIHLQQRTDSTNLNTAQSGLAHRHSNAEVFNVNHEAHRRPDPASLMAWGAVSASSSGSRSRSQSNRSSASSSEFDIYSIANNNNAKPRQRAIRGSKSASNTPSPDTLQFYASAPHTYEMLEQAKNNQAFYLFQSMYPLRTESLFQATESINLARRQLNKPIEPEFMKITDGMNSLVHKVGSSMRRFCANLVRPVLDEHSRINASHRVDGSVIQADDRVAYIREHVAFMRNNSSARWCHSGNDLTPPFERAYDSDLLRRCFMTVLYSLHGDGLSYADKVQGLVVEGVASPLLIPFLAVLIAHFYDTYASGTYKQEKISSKNYSKSYTGIRSSFLNMYNDATGVGAAFILSNIRQWQEQALQESEQLPKRFDLEPVVQRSTMTLEQARSLIEQRERTTRQTLPVSSNTISSYSGGRINQVLDTTNGNASSLGMDHSDRWCIGGNSGTSLDSYNENDIEFRLHGAGGNIDSTHGTYRDSSANDGCGDLWWLNSAPCNDGEMLRLYGNGSACGASDKVDELESVLNVNGMLGPYGGQNEAESIFNAGMLGPYGSHNGSSVTSNESGSGFNGGTSVGGPVRVGGGHDVAMGWPEYILR
ncbi:hypothetical protein C8F01DRAFT_1248693 [Mycena amicta]|nr:hypothetical protein C8F01DRAFT_1248693 [Mycena amicta]